MPIENCPVKSRKRNITNECSCKNFAIENAEPNRSSIEMARAISHTGVPLPNNVIVENSQFSITRRRPNAKFQTISPKQTIPHQRFPKAIDKQCYTIFPVRKTFVYFPFDQMHHKFCVLTCARRHQPWRFPGDRKTQCLTQRSS